MKIVLKVVGGLIAVLLLLFLGAYLLYNEPLPHGTSGLAADRLGRKMMTAVGSENLNNTPPSLDHRWFAPLPLGSNAKFGRGGLGR